MTGIPAAPAPSATLAPAILERLEAFFHASRFAERGGIVTDLDGTAILEDRGRIVIPRAVEYGLKRVHELGRPVVLNTLRFPLSVLQTMGRAWYAVSNQPIPAVTLNGSLLGRVVKTGAGEMEFEELEAFPLSAAEIEKILGGVEELVGAGIEDLLVFSYPRDWRVGEVIWTPVPDRVRHVKEKFVSASAVTAVEPSKLREKLLAEETCMVFLLIDVPEDRLMAYQHARQRSFFTGTGVDKLSGARRMAERLGFDLVDSVGAGDTELDRFLAGVGLALVVGNEELPFRGAFDTLRLASSRELGELLHHLAGLQAAAKV